MFPSAILSFIVKNRTTYTIIEDMMKAFQFEEDVFWQYDSYQIISNMKLAVVLVSYNHHLNAEKGKLENKESWEEVRQILQEKDKTPSKEVSVMDVTMVTPPKQG